MIVSHTGADMFLVSLIYTSEMTGSMDFMDILEVSRARNERDGITGVLLFCNNNVVQCLEGSREAVNKTYARIVQDKRHQNPLLVDYRILSTRLFSEWSMGYVPESSVTQPTLLKYSVSQDFEPRLLSGESCLRMLAELTRKVSTV
jgi:hypothetical protein